MGLSGFIDQAVKLRMCLGYIARFVRIGGYELVAIKRGVQAPCQPAAAIQGDRCVWFSIKFPGPH